MKESTVPNLGWATMLVPRTALSPELAAIMKMKKKDIQGQFEVIDSFAIRSREQFYLIGQISEGIIQENWFLNVPLNSTLDLTLRILQVEEVEMSSEDDKYVLIVISSTEEATDLLLALNIGSEYLDVTTNGQD